GAATRREQTQLRWNGRFLTWLLALTVREQSFTTQTPQLIAGPGDQHDDNDDGKDGCGLAAAFRDADERAESVLGPHIDFGHDDPAPADAINTAQVVPDIGLGHRK